MHLTYRRGDPPPPKSPRLAPAALVRAWTRRGRETLPSPTPPHTTLPCCCSRLRRTTVGLEPTIFGIVFRRLVHQAKEALNAIRPPRALNARPWQLRLFGSQAWGLLGRAKQSLRPPPRGPPRGGAGRWGGGGRRGQGPRLCSTQLAPRLRPKQLKLHLVLWEA